MCMHLSAHRHAICVISSFKRHIGREGSHLVNDSAWNRKVFPAKFRDWQITWSMSLGRSTQRNWRIHCEGTAKPLHFPEWIDAYTKPRRQWAFLASHCETLRNLSLLMRIDESIDSARCADQMKISFVNRAKWQLHRKRREFPISVDEHQSAKPSVFCVEHAMMSSNCRMIILIECCPQIINIMRWCKRLSALL